MDFGGGEYSGNSGGGKYQGGGVWKGGVTQISNSGGVVGAKKNWKNQEHPKTNLDKVIGLKYTGSKGRGKRKEPIRVVGRGREQKKVQQGKGGDREGRGKKRNLKSKVKGSTNVGSPRVGWQTGVQKKKWERGRSKPGPRHLNWGGRRLKGHGSSRGRTWGLGGIGEFRASSRVKGGGGEEENGGTQFKPKGKGSTIKKTTSFRLVPAGPWGGKRLGFP